MGIVPVYVPVTASWPLMAAGVWTPTSPSSATLKGWWDAEYAYAFPDRVLAGSDDFAVEYPITATTLNVSNCDLWCAFMAESPSTGAGSQFGPGVYLGPGVGGSGSYNLNLAINPSVGGVYAEWYNVGSGDNPNITTTTPFSASTRYFVVFFWNNTTKVIGVSVNGAAFDTATFGAVAGLTGNGSNPIVSYFSGLSGWKLGYMAIGAPVSGTLDAATRNAIRDAFYASSWGIPYEALTAGQKTTWGLLGYWHMDQASGTFTDSHGTNHIGVSGSGANGIVGSYTRGVNSYLTTDNDVVYKLVDRSGNGNHFLQPTYSGRPAFMTSQTPTGKPAVVFDGSDKWMDCANNFINGWTAGHILTRLKSTDPAVGVDNSIYRFSDATHETDVVYTDGLAYGAFLSTNWVSVNPSPDFNSFQTFEEYKTGGNLSMVINGSVVAGPSAIAAGVNATPVLGAGRSPVAGTGRGNGRFARVLVYNAALSAADAANARTYLAV